MAPAGPQRPQGREGIAILAPCKYKPKFEDEDGEERTLQHIRGFRIVYVFDISQTNGEPLEDTDALRPRLLDGDAPEGRGCVSLLTSMAIYDKPVRLLIRDMASDLAPAAGVIFSKKQAIEWFQQNYPSIKQGTVSAHLIRFSTNAPSRLHHNIRPEEDLFFQVDRSLFRLYDPSNDPAPIHAPTDLPGELVRDDRDAEEVPVVAPSEFAYESDLRDFLARNVSIIEPGLRLYEDEGITGVEFPVGGRFVDILGVDKHGNLVVVELKVSRGYDRVVGQLLRYMAWLEKHHAEPSQKVRGIIIAREISEDLKLACLRVHGVSLYEYRLSVEVKGVELD